MPVLLVPVGLIGVVVLTTWLRAPVVEDPRRRGAGVVDHPIVGVVLRALVAVPGVLFVKMFDVSSLASFPGGNLAINYSPW
jgi:hypothetical protein